ncbi:PP2C family protein-serine/threonine phosphatase [Streptomyces sp. NPDC050560]|uniref:PP2C family protein-serine/threonine phosphatase n=1 Tax=Streptomyces sp. NPDC050560 TaxID=3365630 RepID=UPI00379DF64C
MIRRSPPPRTVATLTALRRAARRVADAYGLGVETRARLAVSVSLAAHTWLAGHRTVSLAATRDDNTLTVTLTCPPGADPPHPSRLPLPAEFGPDGTTRWHLPLPPRDAPAVDGDDDQTESELAAVLARMDTLTVDHARLKDELDETNSGVLALYVQLEERDEQLRRSHGQMLRKLEDALRPAPLTVPGLRLAVHYEPAETDAPSGGDLYDWFVLPDKIVHITVVDALGHGIGSTRTALSVTHTVRTLALEGHPLEDIVRRAAENLAIVDPDLTATVLLARLDPRTGELHLANGSHPPPLLVRRDGHTRYLQVSGRGVGFPLPGSEATLSTHLTPGDLLLLYTDGLTESRKNPVEGEQRLITSALRHREQPIDAIPRAIADEMHGSTVLHPDDTLALALRLTPKPLD